MNLGLSGRLTRATIHSPLTPLFLLAALVVGLVAVTAIPREEEPQISVPMVDIRVNANGLKAPDAAELVTKPLEAIVKAIDGVEHVYSQTKDDRVMLTVALFGRHQERRRRASGQREDPRQFRPDPDRHPGAADRRAWHQRCRDRGADAVADACSGGHWTDKDLYELAAKLRTELTKVDDVGTSLHRRHRPRGNPGRTRP